MDGLVLASLAVLSCADGWILRGKSVAVDGRLDAVGSRISDAVATRRDSSGVRGPDTGHAQAEHIALGQWSSHAAIVLRWIAGVCLGASVVALLLGESRDWYLDFVGLGMAALPVAAFLVAFVRYRRRIIALEERVKRLEPQSNTLLDEFQRLLREQGE